MEYDAGSIEREEDLGTDQKAVVRRWLLELKLADKREENWRKSAEKVWNRYRQKEAKKNSFNILWSNTETLRPAVYNSAPKPDVRRRYKDADPLGKAASEVLSRSLEYGIDTTDFNDVIKSVVLDALLPGRGLARVRYVPSIECNEAQEESEDESEEGYTEEVAWEQAPIEHVQWDDVRFSEGKEWAEVCWVAFKHRLTREEMEEKFGEIGSKVNLDATDEKELEGERDEKIRESFKTAEVWEIWDKDKAKVFFISKGYKEAPLQTLDDPLNLVGFFPVPRPVYAVEDSNSFVPVALYELYKEQADELDTITRRINVIVKGLKLRGVYDATISELSELMRGEDNDLIPSANVTAILERGGIEKAIFWLPIDMAAKVLQVLYQQRESTKQVIYEITGISDILRGASNANETATAQQIKNQWGSQRLKRLQSEVARFVRDLIRIQSEIIGERFSIETLKTMTGVNLPTEQDKQLAMMQGQQVDGPTWEEVKQILQDDKLRTFKVDVETDSTIAASIESDMAGLRDTLTAVVQVVQGFGPAVQMQAIPVEAVKEIVLAVVRRAKLGNAVEDALDKIQQPQPPQQQQDNSGQIEQMKLQAQQQMDQSSAQRDMAKHESELEFKRQESQMIAQREQMMAQIESEREQTRLAAQKEIEQMRIDAQNDIEWRKARLDAETKVIVAQIGAMNKEQSQNQPEEVQEGENVESALQAALQSFQMAVERLGQPQVIKKNSDGSLKR